MDSHSSDYKTYSEVTYNTNSMKSGYFYYAHTVEAPGTDWGNGHSTYTGISIIDYLSSADEEPLTSVWTKLEVDNNISVFYDPWMNRVRLVEPNRGLKFMDVQQAIGLDEKGVFLTSEVNGVLNKDPNAALVIASQVMSYTKYLDFAGGMLDLWEDLQRESSAGEMGNKRRFLNGDYEKQKGHYKDKKGNPYAIQLIASGTDKRFIAARNDYISLEGLVYPEEDGYNANLSTRFKIAPDF